MDPFVIWILVLAGGLIGIGFLIDLFKKRSQNKTLANRMKKMGEQFERGVRAEEIKHGYDER